MKTKTPTPNEHIGSQFYLLEIRKAGGLGDLSKDLACELDYGFVPKESSIHIKKLNVKKLMDAGLI